MTTRKVEEEVGGVGIIGFCFDRKTGECIVRTPNAKSGLNLSQVYILRGYIDELEILMQDHRHKGNAK